MVVKGFNSVTKEEILEEYLFLFDGFGGLVVSMPLVPEFAGSIPTEAVGFFPM
jgi:hypothetical protein